MSRANSVDFLESSGWPGPYLPIVGQLRAELSTLLQDEARELAEAPLSWSWTTKVGEDSIVKPLPHCGKCKMPSFLIWCPFGSTHQGKVHMVHVISVCRWKRQWSRDLRDDPDRWGRDPCGPNQLMIRTGSRGQAVDGTWAKSWWFHRLGCSQTNINQAAP